MRTTPIAATGKLQKCLSILAIAETGMVRLRAYRKAMDAVLFGPGATEKQVTNTACSTWQTRLSPMLLMIDWKAPGYASSNRHLHRIGTKGG